MAKLFFRNTETGNRYEVISLDKETKKITLRGLHSTFEENYSPGRFKALGYVLEKETEDA